MRNRASQVDVSLSVLERPLSKGFMTPTLISFLKERNAARLADIAVFPTPVSVPVMKIAFTGLLYNCGYNNGKTDKYTGTNN